MRLTNLETDVLRTLVLANDLGSFIKAADRVGRSQSAVSLQMKKLEEQVGQQLFKKQGRGLALTDAGDILIQYARRILELNDEAVSMTRGVAIEGSVRFGLPQDLAQQWLPLILSRFRQFDPQVHVESQVTRNRDLIDQISRGALDLALIFGEADRIPHRTLAARWTPVCWIGRQDTVIDRDTPLSLALLDVPCMFRQAGLEALHDARRQWRIGFTSPNLTGLWAAVEAELGITVRTGIGLPSALTVLDTNLPRLQPVELMLIAAGKNLIAPMKRFQDILVDILQGDTAAEQSPENTAESQYFRTRALENATS